MVTLPFFRVVTRPVELTVARVGSDVVHVAEAAGLVVPSEKVSVALNCCVRPAATEDPCGPTEIDCSVGGGGGITLFLPPPPNRSEERRVGKRGRYRWSPCH